MGNLQNNSVYIKREDFIPFSFGGNKARKARLFFEELLNGDYDCVVTYGSSSSNHCRVVSNLAAANDMKCYIIAPLESSEETFNSCMMELFGAEITVVPVDKVSETIDDKLADLKKVGKKPYFIAGGGHGNLGTEAYVECYQEIKDFEASAAIDFDYIFHASGTGTTQAGLICGKLIYKDNTKIVGISIARKNPRGRNVVLKSARDYLVEKSIAFAENELDDATVFEDGYTGDGYGSDNSSEVIDQVLIKYGIPFDSTYTGKAFAGMLDYLEKNSIKDKYILFIHTGGTPLFFDHLRK